MDSNINNEKNGLQQNPLSWDNMNDGIFERVLDKDPEFFDAPKNKRRVLWIFLPIGALILFAIAYSISGVNSGRSDSAPRNEAAAETASSESESRVKTNTPSVKPILSENITLEASLSRENGEGPSVLGAARQIDEHLETGVVPGSLEEQVGGSSNTSTGHIMNAEENSVTGAGSPDSDKSVVPSRRRSVVIQRLNAAKVVKGLSLSRYFNTMRGNVIQPPRPDSPKRSNKPECRWEINASGGGLFSSSTLSGTSPSVPLRNDHSSGLFGFTTSVGAAYYLTRSTHVSVGLSYAQAYQNIDITTERNIEVTESEVLLSVTHFVVGSRTLETYGDTTVNAIERNRLVYTNNFRWLHLTVGLGHSFDLNKWQIRPEIGGAFGRMVSDGYSVAADGKIIEYDRTNTLYTSQSFKLWGALAISRQLNDVMGINIRYRLDKQVNNASVEPNVVFKPMFHHLEAGLSIRLCPKK